MKPWSRPRPDARPFPGQAPPPKRGAHFAATRAGSGGHPHGTGSPFPYGVGSGAACLAHSRQPSSGSCPWWRIISQESRRPDWLPRPRMPWLISSAPLGQCQLGIAIHGGAGLASSARVNSARRKPKRLRRIARCFGFCSPSPCALPSFPPPHPPPRVPSLPRCLLSLTPACAPHQQVRGGWHPDLGASRGMPASSRASFRTGVGGGRVMGEVRSWGRLAWIRLRIR